MIVGKVCGIKERSKTNRNKKGKAKMGERKKKKET